MADSHYRRLRHGPPPSDSKQTINGRWYHVPWTQESKANYVVRNMVFVVVVEEKNDGK